MTRETDSPSSGPQGRGGAAYPSGTPPYGSRPFPSLHPQERTRPPGEPDDGADGTADAAAPVADEPRTETTLTTRIRINIPGSRPIPPVVVRTTVEDAAAPAEPPAQPAAAEPEPQAPAEPEPEKTSDWFAPRKAAPQQAPSSPQSAASPYGRDESTGGMPLPPYGGGGAPGGAPATPFGADGAQGAQGAQGAPFGRDESTGGMPLPPFGEGGAGFGPDEAAGTAPLPVRNPGGSRGATAAGSSTPGSLFGVAPGEQAAEAPYLPPPAGSAPGEGEAARGPHDTPAGGFAVPFANEAPPFGAGSPFDTGSVPQGGGEAPPFGAGSPFDTGSVPQGGGEAPPFGAGSPFDTGSVPQGGGEAPPFGAGSPFDTAAMPAVDDGSPAYDTGSQQFGTADFPPGVPRPTEQGFPGGEDAPSAPFGPTASATGAMNVPPVTPEAARPPTGPNGFRPPAPPPRGQDAGVSGDTLVSGIPTVPSGESRAPRQAPPRAAAPAPAPVVTEPAEKPAAPAAPRPAKKKGRSKPVLLGVAAGGVLVVAYGAGLLMNHADVPKGTTVLGVDIGNQNRDAAVKMLDTALGNRATAPIQLTVGGKKQTLKPSVAGLAIDTDATVREVAHADYNPVSVIGSLFGGSRTADPVFVVDEDKLKVALQTLAGSGTGGTDAMVRFENHKAIGVPGTPRRTLDVAAATAQVEAAYRTRAETGADTPVALNATTVPPKVSQAELDKAVNGFGKAAMSGKATVRADAAHTIDFNKTVPQFLTMVATPEGKLTPHIDLDTLKNLYGTRFDHVLLRRPDGSKTEVTPQDVATALIKALAATDPADRTVTLPNVV